MKNYMHFGLDLMVKQNSINLVDQWVFPQMVPTLVVGAPFIKGVVRIYKLNQAKTNYTQFGSDIVGEDNDRFWLVGEHLRWWSYIDCWYVRLFKKQCPCLYMHWMNRGSSYAEIGSASYGQMQPMINFWWFDQQIRGRLNFCCWCAW